MQKMGVCIVAPSPSPIKSIHWIRKCIQGQTLPARALEVANACLQQAQPCNLTGATMQSQAQQALFFG